MAAARSRRAVRNDGGARASASVASCQSAHSACRGSWKVTSIRSQPSASGSSARTASTVVTRSSRRAGFTRTSTVTWSPPRPEPRAAFPPGPVQIDPVRSLGRLGEGLGGQHPGQPIGAVRAGSRRQQVAPVADGHQADRVHRPPLGGLVGGRVVDPQLVSGEHRPPDLDHRRVGHPPRWPAGGRAGRSPGRSGSAGPRRSRWLDGLRAARRPPCGGPTSGPSRDRTPAHRGLIPRPAGRGPRRGSGR